MGYELFDITTLVLSGILLLLNIKKVKQSSLYIIYLMFFGIYVLPLFLDYILGFPSYFFHWDATYTSFDRYEGFILSYQDATTRILYDAFLIGTQFILLSFNRPVNSGQQMVRSYQEKVISLSTHNWVVLFSFAALPPLLSLFVGYSYIPFYYGWRENPLLSEIQYGAYYSVIERLSYIGLTASMICMVHPKGKWPLKMLMLLLCYMNLSIESKRSLLFFAIAVYVLLKAKGHGIRFNNAQIAGLIVIGIILVVYQSILTKIGRGYSDEDILYTNIRIDLFRDDTARLIIYSFISNHQPVVSYPFQSYLTQIAFLFPLDIINGLGRLGITAIGFNRYLTSALINVPLSYGEIWMTTSMIDEIIANFAFFSVLIVPLALKNIAKIIDRKNDIMQVLGLSTIVLAFMYSFNYIAYYFEFLLLMNFLIKRQRI